VPGSGAKSLWWLRIGMECGQLHLALPEYRRGRYQGCRSVKDTILFEYSTPAIGVARCWQVFAWHIHGLIC